MFTPSTIRSPLTEPFPPRGILTKGMATGTTIGEEEAAIREVIKETGTTEEDEEAGMLTTTTAASHLEDAMTMRARRTVATQGEDFAPPLEGTILIEEATGAAADSSPGAEEAGAITAEVVPSHFVSLSCFAHVTLTACWPTPVIQFAVLDWGDVSTGKLHCCMQGLGLVEGGTAGAVAGGGCRRSNKEAGAEAAEACTMTSQRMWSLLHR